MQYIFIKFQIYIEKKNKREKVEKKNKIKENVFF